MSDDAKLSPADGGLIRRSLLTYREQSGQPLTLWAVVAALNFLAQIFLRRELHMGEFGMLNSALGAIGLITVPLAALHLAFTLYFRKTHPAEPAPRIEALRNAAFLVTESFGWVWGGLSVLLIFAFLPLIQFSRFSLNLFVLMNALVALGGILSWALCQERKQLRFWGGLLVSAAASRALVGALMGWLEPWAESGLAALLLAGFVTLVPVLGTREVDSARRWKACLTAWDRDFLIHAGAVFSVLLGIYLFINADRIVAQRWLGVAVNNNIGIIDWPTFDAYQTAGLLGRGLLWGTQPLLWILFAQRLNLKRTTAASFRFFWIYLGALIVGAILLGCLKTPISLLFCGANYQATALFVPSFAAVMVVLGLLQAIGVFALASGRLPECFLFGATSIGYSILLFCAGEQAQLIPAYMFGGGLISLMLVLFLGVVRWGRKQP